MAGKLTIQTGPQRGTERVLDGPIIIGRHASADLSIEDPGVSRRHAKLTAKGRDWYVEDLGSANGTRVNGVTITDPTKLEDGDVVAVGSTSAIFTDDSTGDLSVPANPTPAPDTTAAANVVLRMPADSPAPLAIAHASPDAAGPGHIAAQRLRFMERIGAISDLVFDVDTLLTFVVEDLFDLVPNADRVFVMRNGPDGYAMVPGAVRTRSGAASQVVASRTLLQDVVTRREAILVADAQVDLRFAQSDSIHATGLRSAICAPIIFEREVYGLIQMDSRAGLMPFGRAEVALTLALASQVGLALAYAGIHAKMLDRQLVEQDMAHARKIQQRFLPKQTPSVAGYSFSVEYLPAMAVGGDFYDFLALGQGLLAIVAGDVSGKGVSAALYAAKVLSDVRYQAVGQTEPAAILDAANRVLADDEDGMFVTAAVAVLRPADGLFTVASAGHPLPLVRDRFGTIAPLGGTGDAPLGVNTRSRFQQFQYQLDEGDAVVLYTDGVVEAMNARKDLFGESRLIDALKGSDGTADGVRQDIVSAVAQFAGDQSQSDDLTLVCVRRDTD